MFNIFKKKSADTSDMIAAMLKTDKNALVAFEKAYAAHALNPDINNTDNPLGLNSRQAAAIHKRLDASGADTENIADRIINELLSLTAVWSYDGKHSVSEMTIPLPDGHKWVTAADINALPEEQRPMLTGNLMSIDINEPSSKILLEYLNMFMTKNDPNAYHRFRQGLDILDYDELMYAMMDTNPNSMSHWLPQLTEAVATHSFFKIPATTIIHVPMPVLQLTRKDYSQITPVTLDILNKYCMTAFNLNPKKEYFIKTGTYSSKFDFRNAHVMGEKEVREIGEYLLFIHWQANQMASPLNNKCVYGVSTTTEWVVREFIQDKENNPTIYKGLPLHTEYRVFVDFDIDSVLAVAPYWEPETMKRRFAEHRDNHDAHDEVIYKMHEDTLMQRYYNNKSLVASEIRKILPDINLTGQWSIDIMQNGDDFYIIDMALAENSAYYNYVPVEMRRPTEENWLPDTTATTKALTAHYFKP